MYSTKIVKNIDNLGRFKLPVEWLNLYGVKPNSRLKITRGKARIVIEPELHKCIFCNSIENIHVYKDKFVCSKCANSIKQMIKDKTRNKQQTINNNLRN